MQIHKETLQRTRNGFVYASVAGLVVFALTWPMLALMVVPGTDLIDMWMRTADVPLSAILLANIVGFVYGYRRNKIDITHQAR